MPSMQVSQWEEKEAEHPHPLDPQFPQQAKSGGRNGTTDCLRCGRTALKEPISDWLHSVEWHQQFGLHPPVCWHFQEGRCLAETLVRIVDRRLWMLSSAQPLLERDSTYEVQHKVQCSHHTNLEYHILVNTTIIFLILQGKKRGGGLKKRKLVVYMKNTHLKFCFSQAASPSPTPTPNKKKVCRLAQQSTQSQSGGLSV